MNVLKIASGTIAEVEEFCRHYGAVAGQPVLAGNVCRYIWTGTEARKPTDIEAYLFRGMK
ncbi:MAG: hypothetical protein ACXWT5_13350 [Methylophilus sp.]